MTINLEKSLEIDAPIDAAYEQWADFSASSGFMPNLRGTVEVTEQVPGESISWRTTSPEFSSTSTVRFKTLDDGERTSVVFSAHYPQGAGPSHSVTDIAASMQDGLQRFAAVLLGQPIDGLGDADDLSQADASDALSAVSTYADTLTDTTTQAATAALDASSSLVEQLAEPIGELQQTLGSATDAWVGNVMKAFDTPFYQFGQLIWDMEKQFTGFIWGNLDNRRVSASDESAGTWTPSFELSRQGDQLLASADLPGHTADHLHVEIRDGRLLVSGEQGEERFHVSLELTEPVDSRQVDASLSESGRLEIKLPLKANPQAQQDPGSRQGNQNEAIYAS